MKVYKIECSTGCTCCSYENHYIGNKVYEEKFISVNTDTGELINLEDDYLEAW